MEKYTDTSKVSLRPIDKKTAIDIIKKYHYTHKAPGTLQDALGVYYRGDDTSKFFDDDEKLIGCIMYGYPVGRHVINSIVEDENIKSTNICELLRLFIHDGYGKNIESYVIGQSFKWLKENRPKVKILVSYADPEAGHIGYVYQSTNWMFQCPEPGGAIWTSLTKDPYEWMHPRSVHIKFGFAGKDGLKSVLDKPFYIKKSSPKYRYLYLLGNKRENRLLKSKFKYPNLPYPKDNDYEMKVIEVIPDKKNKINKFI